MIVPASAASGNVCPVLNRHMRATSPGTRRRDYGAVCPLQSAGYRAAEEERPGGLRLQQVTVAWASSIWNSLRLLLSRRRRASSLTTADGRLKRVDEFIPSCA